MESRPRREWVRESGTRKPIDADSYLLCLVQLFLWAIERILLLPTYLGLGPMASRAQCGSPARTPQGRARLWTHRNKGVFDGVAPIVVGALAIAEDERRSWSLAEGSRSLPLGCLRFGWLAPCLFFGWV